MTGCKEIISAFNALHSVGNLSLNRRKSAYLNFFADIYGDFREKMTDKLIKTKNAEKIVLDHTSWMDSWMTFTWKFVWEEKTLLMREVSKSSDQKIRWLKKSLPLKIRKQSELERLLAFDHEAQIHMDPTERSYNNNMLKEIRKEINESLRELETLEEIVPLIGKTNTEENRILDILSIFARGGYGREELTFSSDIDLGYCLDLSNATGLETQIAQELIKRMENLFQNLSIDVASQYFELGDDLSQFSKPDMLHTITSILEGRIILGRSEILDQLRSRMLNICPLERMIRFLKTQMDGLVRQDNAPFFIKEGFGGIRHLQYILWMVLIVVHHECGNSRFLLSYLKEKNWITEYDKINLLQAMEFYFDLRNFLGLYDCCQKRLEPGESGKPAPELPIRKDVLDDSSTLMYLKLKQRFATIDCMDRFRLHSTRIVSKLAQSISAKVLDRTISERLPCILLEKHSGTNRITRLFPVEKQYQISWNLQSRLKERGKTSHNSYKEEFKILFLNLTNLFDLFIYIGKKGIYLSPELKNRFSALVQTYYETVDPFSSNHTRDFIFNLFSAENSSVAIEQMLEIATPLNHKGDIQTLLGLFLPEVNRMRYLMRNLDIHEYPLCIHSLNSLRQVEKEIEVIQKKEPELWRFIGEDNIFALKWSVFFHDIGKIDPYRDHEKYGPIISSEMLSRLGWKEGSGVLDLIRLLIANHQSVVRYSQLSPYLDIGILKFFELAQRNPGKVVLLYLINLSDFKSINSELKSKAAHLENFFEKTMSILDEFKKKDLTGSLTEIVNNYLERKIEETKVSVLLELLTNQCCHKSLEDVILAPLREISQQEATRLEKNSDELENALTFLKLAEMDSTTLEKHRFRFREIIKREISDKNIFSIVSPLNDTWNWFFTALPHRYLLDSNVEILTSQLQRFERDLSQKSHFSIIKGARGEYDTLLFHCVGDAIMLAKTAYTLSWSNINIEYGKINKVFYADNREGWVGFFKVSHKNRKNGLSTIELETAINNLQLPPLNPLPVTKIKKPPKVNILYFQELEKGYLVKEKKKNRFFREHSSFEVVKISLYDNPFVFYKIMRSFEAAAVVPQQVTITTIGNQIIDFFYYSPDQKKRMMKNDFQDILHKYINANITIS